MKITYSFLVAAFFYAFASVADDIPTFTPFSFGDTSWASFGTSYTFFLLGNIPISGSAPAEFAHDAENSRILLDDGGTRQFISNSSPAYIAFRNPSTGELDSCFTTDVTYSDMVAWWGEALSRSDNNNRRFLGHILDVATCNGDRLSVDILQRNANKNHIKRFSFITNFPVFGELRTIHGEINFDEFENHVDSIDWNLPASCETPFDYCSVFFPITTTAR